MAKDLENLPRIKITKETFKNIPQTPGIYIFWQINTPIYVGKANNLRSRLSSYLEKVLLAKTVRMVSEAKDVSFVKVGSELEALLLEARLIRKFQPIYNSVSKDDKHPLYIKITKEKYSRVITARKIDEEGGCLAFYGPFPSGMAVKQVLTKLRRVFPYADHKLGKLPCFYNHIGLCNPCPNIIEKSQDGSREILRKKYLANIRAIKKVLDGNLKRVLTGMLSEMDKRSKNEEFEEAAKLREQILSFEYITQSRTHIDEYIKDPNRLEDIRLKEQNAFYKLISKYIKLKKVPSRVECFDVAHLGGTAATASMVTFIEGEPEKSLYRNFRIRQGESQDDVSSMWEVIKRRINNFDKWGRPDLIIVDGGKTQVKVFFDALVGEKVPVVGIAKRFETLVIPKIVDAKLIYQEVKIPIGPALNMLQRIRDEAHRFARRYHHHLLKKSLLPM